MRVETNDALIKRMRRLAQYLFFGSFGVLVIWFIVSTQQFANPNFENNSFVTVVLPSILLPAAFVCSMISVRFTNLWVRSPRPEDAIRQQLKGISNKSVLYNYYHIPARHVLISPQGVYAIVTRFQDGMFSVNGEQWRSHKSPVSRFFSIFRFDAIGNPTVDAQRAAAMIQAKIATAVPDVRVHPLIVFVDRKVIVQIEGDSVVPIVFTSEDREPSLKDFLRSQAQQLTQQKAKPLSPEQLSAIDSALKQ
jgi:hypothetical protein